MSEITNAFEQVHRRIDCAARQAGVNRSDINLIAVTKTKPVSALREAIELGQRSFGENYVQECVEKIDALGRDGLEWHFIGPLQSNKTKAIAERVDWVHSVDRLKIAQRLSAQRPSSLPALNVCIQVNIDREEQKSGVLPEEVFALATAIADLPNLKLRGLMAIPAANGNSVDAFKAMANLRKDLEKSAFNLDTLSMGMTSDFELAIQHGATHIRVGTALFGTRNRAG
jgi:pyridoxal phosphate enzyme (YggS family)